MPRLETNNPETQALTQVEFEAAQTLAQLKWDQMGMEGITPLNDDQIRSMSFLAALRQSESIENAMKKLGMSDPLAFAKRVRSEILPPDAMTLHSTDFSLEELETFKGVLQARLLQAQAVHGSNVPPHVMRHLRVTHALQTAINFEDALSLGGLVTPSRQPFSPDAFRLVARSVVAGFNEACQ